MHRTNKYKYQIIRLTLRRDFELANWLCEGRRNKESFSCAARRNLYALFLEDLKASAEGMLFDDGQIRKMNERLKYLWREKRRSSEARTLMLPDGMHRFKLQEEYEKEKARLKAGRQVGPALDKMERPDGRMKKEAE